MTSEKWDRRVSSDSMGLAILSVMFIIKGISYLGNPDVELPSAERWMTLWGWAAIWMVCGAIAGASVISRRYGAAAAGIVTAVLFLWGIMYEIDFILSLIRGDAANRGWSIGAVYLTFAAILAWAFRRGEPQEPKPALPIAPTTKGVADG